jgi:hypothetical protein
MAGRLIPWLMCDARQGRATGTCLAGKLYTCRTGQVRRLLYMRARALACACVYLFEPCAVSAMCGMAVVYDEEGGLRGGVGDAVRHRLSLSSGHTAAHMQHAARRFMVRQCARTAHHICCVVAASSCAAAQRTVRSRESRVVGL